MTAQDVLDRLSGKHERDALRLARRWAEAARRNPPSSGEFLSVDLDLIADEIERLRAALKRIATDQDVSSLDGNPALWPSTIAADALLTVEVEK